MSDIGESSSWFHSLVQLSSDCVSDGVGSRKPGGGEVVPSGEELAAESSWSDPEAAPQEQSDHCRVCWSHSTLCFGISCSVL